MFHIPPKSGITDTTPSFPPRSALLYAAAAIVLLLVPLAGKNVVISSDAFLAIHTIIEIVSISVSIMIFVLGWLTHTDKQHRSIVVFSSLFIGTAALDLCHLLSYDGMPDFVTPSDPNKAIWFWLIARLLSGFAFLFLVALPDIPFARSYSRHIVLTAITAAAGLTAWLVLYNENWLPVTFVRDSGLTSFKIGFEIAIILQYLLTAVLIFRQRGQARPYRWQNLFAALLLMIVSELCFTIYSQVVELTNMIGHIYKIAAYVIIYVAIFWDQFHLPYQSLQLSERELRITQRRLFTTLESIGDPVMITDDEGRIRFMNRAATAVLGLPDQAVGRPVPDLFPVSNVRLLEAAIRDKQAVPLQQGTLPARGEQGPVPVEYSMSPVKEADRSLLGFVIVFRDISERHRAEATNARLISILENAVDLISTANTEGQILYCNKAMRETLRLAGDGNGNGDGDGDAVRLHIRDLHPENVLPVIFEQGLPAAATAGNWRGETALLGGDGREIPVSQVIVAHRSRDGVTEYYSTIMRDISERLRSEAREKLAETVFRHINEAIMVTGPDQTIHYVNNAFAKMTGYSEGEAIGQRPSLLSSGWHSPEFYRDMWKTMDEQGHWEGEIWDKKKNGDMFLALLHITPVFSESGKLLYRIGVFRDITEKKQLEAKIQHLAYHDSVTGLPNRVLLHERVGQALLFAEKQGRQAAVLFLDLDRFKRINESLGHSQGDAVLKHVGELMLSVLGASDTASRIGGDEFIVLLPDLRHTDRCKRIADELIGAISKPFSLEGQPYVLNCSIGISLYPEDGEDAESLIRHAGEAMYAAKNGGPNRRLLYSELPR